MTTRRLLAVAAAAFAALVAPVGAQAADYFATVGPGFTIDLRDAAGQRVVAIDPGTHRITVDDRSEFHNFHLRGPGVERATDIEFVGTVVWDVTLTDGVYVFICDPHQDTMRGSFNVGNVPLPPPPPVPQQLVATVGPRNTISLTLAGRRVSSLTAGAYVITVRDRSRKHNFHFVGPGVNRKTPVARTGTFRWTVTLRAGTYRFTSDPQARRVRGSVRVT